MADEDNRRVRIEAFTKIGIGLGDILISGINCLLRVRLIGQERAHGCLAIARRPYFVCGVKRTGQSAHIKLCNALRLFIAKRRIP